MKKILLTGGHAATTAIAVIEELIRRYGKNGVNISWIGSSSVLEGRKIQGIELKIFPKMGITTHTITAAKLHRKFTKYTIISLIKFPIALIQSLKYIHKIKPDLTLSFGGYAAFPVVISSWIFKIPVIIHEQTHAAGLANRLSEFFSTKILLAREESLKYFSHHKSVVVGNPVMTQVTEVTLKNKIGNPPTIFVMGGSRGSEIINETLHPLLKSLLYKYKIIHITGEHDFEKFSKIKNSNYQVFPWVDPLKIDGLYREADIVVTRSGANTVAELMVVKRPAILIPIPWSYQNEQELNALKAIEFGLAVKIDQNNLNSDALSEKIEMVVNNWEKMISVISGKKSVDLKASSLVVDNLDLFLK